MAKKKVGIRDIAERAGVAMSTVSHVLNGTASISEEVRGRVLEVASDMGYLARRQAKGAIATVTKVMVAVPAEAMPEKDTNLVSWTILSALTRECATRGVQMVPYALAEGVDPKQVVQAAQEAGVSGLVLLNDDRSSLLATIGASGMPAVLINGEDANMRIDSVTPGNRFAAEKATNWLIGQGFQQILHLTWEGRKTVRRRLDGYRDAMKDAESRVAPAKVLFADGFDPKCAEERIAEWLQSEGAPDSPTAIFCAADNLAFGAMTALKQAGLRVPEDVSVMGFDGVALGEFHAPALTTVSIPLQQFATEALSLLEQRIVSGNAPRAARRVELGCDVVVRSSVGRTRG